MLFLSISRTLLQESRLALAVNANGWSRGARHYSFQRSTSSLAMSRRRRVGARVPSRLRPLPQSLMKETQGQAIKSKTASVAPVAAMGGGPPPSSSSLPASRAIDSKCAAGGFGSDFGSTDLSATDPSVSAITDASKSGERLFPVLAIHIAQTIDLSPVFSNIFARDFIKKQMFHKNSFVVQLPPHSPQDLPRYVAVFRFGSLVCINLSPSERNKLVSVIKKNYAREPVLEGSERTEHFGIMLRQMQRQAHGQSPSTLVIDSTDLSFESMDGAMGETAAMTAPPTIVTGDYCVVPELDMNGVAVITNILAQTVALDSYNDMVDDMLSQFAKINSTITSGSGDNGRGKFDASHRQFLFQTVAKNNSIFIDMISKIRIKDRNDTAWNLTKYQDIHAALRGEFEIDERFDYIEFKLNLIQQNAKFFLEVLQSQKSNSLEWIIVALIAVECVIMCMDMSGMGERVVASVMDFAFPSAPPPSATPPSLPPPL